MIWAQLIIVNIKTLEFSQSFSEIHQVLNVLDIVSLVDSILVAGEYNINADVNQDGFNNVLDVVEIVNIIIGQ